MNETIQPGQVWQMRGGGGPSYGELITITDVVPADPMPVKSGTLCWQMNGRYWDDTFESNSDLVKRVE